MLGTIQSAIIHRFIGKIFKEKEDRDPEKKLLILKVQMQIHRFYVK